MASQGLRAIHISINMNTRIVSLRIERPRLFGITKEDVQCLPQFLLRGGSKYRRHNLNAIRQVPVHPVCGTDEEFSLQWIVAAICKVEDAGVLEEPSDNRAHSNVLCSPRYARTKTAESANDQFDLHARFRRSA